MTRPILTFMDLDDDVVDESRIDEPMLSIIVNTLFEEEGDEVNWAFDHFIRFPEEQWDLLMKRLGGMSAAKFCSLLDIIQRDTRTKISPHIWHIFEFFVAAPSLKPQNYN